MSGLCSRMAGPLRAHSRGRRQMIELSATWVNRLALTSMPLLAATPAETHSGARLGAGYTSGAFGAELVNEQLSSRITFDVFKQQCWPARTMLAPRPPFGDPVRDLGDLKNRIGFRLNALQFSRFVQRGGRSEEHT